MGWIGVVARRCALPFRVPSRLPPRVLLGSVALELSIVVAASRASEADYYALLTLPPPDGLKLEVTGMDTLEDGRLAAAIRKGEVWVFDNAYARPPEELRGTRFAQALHEPLGLRRVGDDLFVAQRSELTRLRDSDGDGQADEYVTVAKGWGVSGNYHEYAYGPAIDLAGNFWITLNATIGPKGPGHDAWRGWGMMITPTGELTPICAGMRSPCGIGTNLAGDVFFTDQQGNWIGTNTLSHMRKGAFFGHAASLKSASRPGSPLRNPGPLPTGKTVVEAARRLPAYRLPAVWFPYRKMGQSATGIICDRTGGRFGPFEGQLFVGEFTLSGMSRVFLERIAGEYQGACFPFRSGFQCGVLRMAWGRDGSMFVGETNRGWNSLGTRSYGLQRLVWTGRVPFEVKEMRARPDGFLVTFTLPADRESAEAMKSYVMESYTYTYHSRYGSPEVDTKKLTVASANAAKDGMSVELVVPGLREGYVHELRLPGIRARDGTPLLHPAAYYTLNRIP